MYNTYEDIEDIHFEVFGYETKFVYQPWMDQLVPIYRDNRRKVVDYIKNFQHLAHGKDREQLDAYSATINEELFETYRLAYLGDADAVTNFVGGYELKKAAEQDVADEIRKTLNAWHTEESEKELRRIT